MKPGDRVRIIVDVFCEPWTLGSEWTITKVLKPAIESDVSYFGVDGSHAFLVPSDVELVEVTA